MALDELYKARILEHNRNPRHFGPLARATHRARGTDALCGDDLVMEIELRDGILRAAGFEGHACAVTTAAASMLADWLPGRTPSEFEAARRAFRMLLADPDGGAAPELGELAELRGVGRFPARVRNALLPWRTVAAALAGETEMSNDDRETAA